jgi:PAS domain S-box-containing protein
MRWFVLCMVLALSATLIGFLVRAYRERVAELRELGADLEQRAALLEASQAELQGVLAATADGILAVDRQGRVLLTNRRFAEFWRIPQSLLDRRDDQVLLGQVLGQLARPEAFLAKVRALYDSEAVDADAIEFTDGRTFECFTAPLMLNGTTVGRVWSFSDITERRQAERELRASEEKFAKAFRASPAFICISTLDEGRYIEVNDAYLRGTGRSREEVVGHTVVESGFWNDPQRRARAIELLRRDGRLAGFEMEARKKSGAIFVCELWGELLEFEGRPCVLWVVNDISERKRAEAEIEKLNASLEERVQARTAELRAANRELESFSYTVSHDLRAPLRSMVGFAGLLSENLMQQLDDENRDYLARIAASGNKMSQLIDGVLEYSRLARSAPARRPVDLDLLVGEVIGELREQYPATEVVVHPLGRVDADPVMIRQIFHNLLDNAFKYSGKSARPCVEVGTQTDTPADTAAGASRSGACYFVRDNGVGFDMRHAEHLFSLFTRLHSDPHFESTGAGLAIVKRLVERHGGSIRAVAAPGRGATFSFCV